MNKQPEFDGAPSEGNLRLPSLKLVLLVLVAAAAVIFFLQNGDQVEVNFLVLDGEWALRWIIVISIAIGVLLDRLGSWLWRRARDRKHNVPGG